MKNILVIGSTNIDFTVNVREFPAAGETIMGRSLTKIPGGKGANQAYACGKLGGFVSFAGAVGDDEFGRLAMDNLKSVHVDTGRVKVVEGVPTGLAMISINQSGNNCIIVIPGANEACDRSFVMDMMEAVDACDILLIQLETPLDGVRAAVDRAKQMGKTVILNPAPAPEAGALDGLLENLTYLTPNETELARITGLPAGTYEEVCQAGEHLLKLGVQNVIVTLGDKGSVLLNHSGRTKFEPLKVSAVDTTAAGDTFNAAVAVKLAQGSGIEEAIRFAGIASGISVTRKGAQPSVPDREEVENFGK